MGTVNRARLVIRARRAGRVACGCYVQPGDLIAKIGQAWVCGRCITAGISDPPADMDR